MELEVFLKFNNSMFLFYMFYSGIIGHSCGSDVSAFIVYLCPKEKRLLSVYLGQNYPVLL